MPLPRRTVYARVKTPAARPSTDRASTRPSPTHRSEHSTAAIRSKNSNGHSRAPPSPRPTCSAAVRPPERAPRPREAPDQTGPPVWPGATRMTTCPPRSRIAWTAIPSAISSSPRRRWRRPGSRRIPPGPKVRAGSGSGPSDQAARPVARAGGSLLRRPVADPSEVAHVPDHASGARGHRGDSSRDRAAVPRTGLNATVGPARV